MSDRFLPGKVCWTTPSTKRRRFPYPHRFSPRYGTAASLSEVKSTGSAHLQPKFAQPAFYGNRSRAGPGSPASCLYATLFIPGSPGKRTRLRTSRTCGDFHRFRGVGYIPWAHRFPKVRLRIKFRLQLTASFGKQGCGSRVLRAFMAKELSSEFGVPNVGPRSMVRRSYWLLVLLSLVPLCIVLPIAPLKVGIGAIAGVDSTAVGRDCLPSQAISLCDPLMGCLLSLLLLLLHIPQGARGFHGRSGIRPAADH